MSTRICVHSIRNTRVYFVFYEPARAHTHTISGVPNEKCCIDKTAEAIHNNADNFNGTASTRWQRNGSALTRLPKRCDGLLSKGKKRSGWRTHSSKCPAKLYERDCIGGDFNRKSAPISRTLCAVIWTLTRIMTHITFGCKATSEYDCANTRHFHLERIRTMAQSYSGPHCSIGIHLHVWCEMSAKAHPLYVLGRVCMYSQLLKA